MSAAHPDPNDRISLHPVEASVRVATARTSVADTTRAVRLDERGYPPRFYIPPEDIENARLRVSQKRTHCPFKGDATYYDVCVDGQTFADAAWSYEKPLPAVAEIARHLAFDHPRLQVRVES